VVFLATFLYRNLKGFRFLAILAILVTFAQVGSDCSFDLFGHNPAPPSAGLCNRASHPSDYGRYDNTHASSKTLEAGS